MVELLEGGNGILSNDKFERWFIVNKYFERPIDEFRDIIELDQRSGKLKRKFPSGLWINLIKLDL